MSKIHDISGTKHGQTKHLVGQKYKKYSGKVKELPDGIYSLGTHTIFVEHGDILAGILHEFGTFTECFIGDTEITGQWDCVHRGKVVIETLQMQCNFNGTEE